MIQLGEHFENDYRHQHSEAARRRQWFIKARHEQARREELAEQSEELVLTTAVAVMVATQAQIDEFEMRLDAYEDRLNIYEAKLDARDIAITKALLENIEQYEALIALRDKLLDNAFNLPDGRKVFKSEDGLSVYFEDGAEVPADLISADAIPDGFTTIEQLDEINGALKEVKKERDALHEAQADNDRRRDRLGIAREKLDSARERIDEGGLTVDEIGEFDAEILELMPKSELPALPPSAAKHLTNGSAINSAPDAKSSFAVNANPATSIKPDAVVSAAPMPE